MVGFQVLSSLFIHNQLHALSAAGLSLPTALFLSAPLMPKALNILHSDCAGNPLAPISTGRATLAVPSLCTVLTGMYTWPFSVRRPLRNKIQRICQFNHNQTHIVSRPHREYMVGAEMEKVYPVRLRKRK
ncbi:hypothetical protein DPMN_014644 [Dreissena polymorpha]|uniref:Uncharacterized protein n=1 Tax=Dreissena polymorpha TaxID=45954 RepID=A0A9D4NB64_DREPO|nr:hypothetical protein DPMN_014644 [Dreissena polymorpha]